MQTKKECDSQFLKLNNISLKSIKWSVRLNMFVGRHPPHYVFILCSRCHLNLYLVWHGNTETNNNSSFLG